MNLTSIPGNEKCADCCEPDPKYSAYNLGILICENCAAIHKTLGPHISKVKSLNLENWDDNTLNSLRSLGNTKVNSKYEENVPLFYKRPLPSDPQVVKEQWIRAKYERKEFFGDKKLSYAAGYKEGYLWKKGKDDKHFQKRRFILDTTENTLKYFRKEEDRDPKGCLRLDGINMMILPKKIGHPNAMQILYEQNEQTRNLFIYADDGQELIEWYTAVRAAKLNRLKIAYPNVDVVNLSTKIMWEYIKEGWLSKTGPRSGDAFRRRWVTLDSKKLTYYEDPFCPYPKGEVFIGSQGFEVEKKLINSGASNSKEVKDPNMAFIVKVPERCFQFLAETVEDADDWVEKIRTVIISN
ncbi:hypothetical protein HELRODRAFT_155972 [Helobdella robusta]|uniref:Arf-GAP with dual PH domain-containing protein 1 n=1 Tax=Helobdella robusta TaxID=6412 RepID=T1ELQ2_HELRO|nr:hypothetical protein HELRODRAFT_155972 [Helobdella robusta]ESN99342.1 hypothetical protein HELRODRAFT_155972 [Helobdella robusta]